MTSVYLDSNATAPIRPEAADAVARALSMGGNASSVHARGRAARALIEDARADVAALVGAGPDQVVLTSGGTEANNLAIASALSGGEVGRLIVGATEHPSVAEPARACGLPVEVFPVDGDGRADLGWLDRRLAAWTAEDGRPFVLLMLANNETGVIQPVAEVAARLRPLNGLLHVDAVQAAGKIDIDVAALGADTLALSAHKLGGPQGVGALVHGSRARIARQLHGGGQERGLRPGTENTPGVAGFGAAARAALRDLPAAAAQAGWRDAAAAVVKAAGAIVAGEAAPRLPNTLCLAIEGWPSTLQVMGLDLEGVMVSAGSACSSGKVKPSGVLEAMGLGALSTCGLRVSGGWASSEADWRRFAEVWTKLQAKRGPRAAPAREVA